MQAISRAKTIKHRTKLTQLVRTKEGFIKSFDGTRIHYRATGKGLPIVCCNGFGVPSFFWKYVESFFKHKYQIVVWNYRGHDNSEVPKKLEHATVDALIHDCKAVFKHLGIKKAVLMGYSLGTQVLLEFYRRHPKQVAAIISCLGTYGRPMDSFYNSPFSKYFYELITLVGSTFPKQGNWLSRVLLKNPFWFQLGGFFKVINTAMANKEEASAYLDHILNLEPVFFSTLLRSVQEHTTEDILKRVKVPTLIIGADEDQFTPVWISKKMHRTIPKSELFIVKRATHAALLEQPELINLRIEKFLKERLGK